MTRRSRCIKSAWILLPPGSPQRAEPLFKLALALDEAGESRQAIRYYQESYALSQSQEDDAANAATLYNLASPVLRKRDNFSQAETAMQSCLVYDKRNGSHREVFRSLMLLSRIAEADRRPEDAGRYAQDALAAAQDQSDKTRVASAYLRLGHLSESTAAWSDASAYYRHAEALAGPEFSEESRQRIRQKLLALQENMQ